MDSRRKAQLLGIAQCNARKASDRILPDIIVHRRRQEGRHNNLLVIEVKKDAEDDPCDQRKLELLTDIKGGYQYGLGLYINIAGGSFVCTWYKGGAKAR